MKTLMQLVLVIGAAFFVAGNFIFSVSEVGALRQSQSITNVCKGNDNPCYTIFCSRDQPCQIGSSDQFSAMPPVDQHNNLQPPEDSPPMTQEDDAIITQPIQDHTTLPSED
jgi:hypothetical protein